MKNKVFCVGFHKTATSSLCAALEYLGFRVKGYEIITDYDDLKVRADRYMSHYDVLRDMPWPIAYEWFDNKYENAKFILTERNEKDWINSIQNHFGRGSHEMHEWVYGSVDPFSDKGKFLKVYRDHNKNVKKIL